MDKLSIDSYSTPIHDITGKEIPLSESQTTHGKGFFTLSLRVVPYYCSHSGKCIA